MRELHRGDIVFAPLDPVRGREQGGRRPVLVVSSGRINRLPLVVTVIVGTDGAKQRRDFSCNVRVPAAESGLPLETVFYAFHIRSLDISRFIDPGTGEVEPVGRLGPARMRHVDEALRQVLAL